jgi:hypothetical protein
MRLTTVTHSPQTVRSHPSTIQRIPFRQSDILFYIQPECKNKINDQGGSHGEKRNINEPGANSGCSYSQAIPYRGANAEGLPLNEILKPAHDYAK